MSNGEGPMLKPCPHCGEAEELYQMIRDMGRGPIYGIDCLGCGSEFIPQYGMDVIAAWNSRNGAPLMPEADSVPALRKFTIQVHYDAKDDDGHRFRATAVYQCEASDERQAYSEAEAAFPPTYKLGAILSGHHDRFP